MSLPLILGSQACVEATCLRLFRLCQSSTFDNFGSDSDSHVDKDYAVVAMWRRLQMTFFVTFGASHLMPRSVTWAGPRSRSSFNLHNHSSIHQHSNRSQCHDNLAFVFVEVNEKKSLWHLIATNTLGKFCWQSWGCRCWPGCRGWGWPGWATPSRRPRSSWGSAPSPGATQVVLFRSTALKSRAQPQRCEGGHCSQLEWNVRRGRTSSGAPGTCTCVGVWNWKLEVEEYWFWHDISPWWKIKPDGSILEPEEAVDDALVCVWQRVVPLITSRDA